jgi:hypothetical protein
MVGFLVIALDYQLIRQAFVLVTSYSRLSGARELLQSTFVCHLICKTGVILRQPSVMHPAISRQPVETVQPWLACNTPNAWTV